MPGLGIRRRRWFGWFRPNHLSGLVLWVDPTRQTEADGVSVPTLIDYSGSGNSITQGTAANQATMKRNFRVGKSVLQFDGANDRYDGGDILDWGTNRPIIFGAVFVNNDGVGATFNVIARKGNPGTTNGTYVFDVVFDGGTQYNVECALRDSGTTLTGFYNNSGNLNEWHVFSMTSQPGAPVIVFRDSNQVGSSSPFVTSSNSYTPSDAFLIGNVGTSYFDGYIGEISIHHVSTLTQRQREKMEGYFCHRWGTAANMSVSHPYYYYPP